MAPQNDVDPAERLAALERDLRELRVRVAALERLLGARTEHPADEASVRKKVAYDWQA